MDNKEITDTERLDFIEKNLMCILSHLSFPDEKLFACHGGFPQMPNSDISSIAGTVREAIDISIIAMGRASGK